MYLQGKLICTAFLLFLCSAQAKAPPTSGGKSVLSDASSTVTPEIEVPAQPVLADIPLLSEIGHNPTADTIKADFQVSAAGSSTYRVPLVFPAGIAGTTPQISFSYDSQSGNGPLGVGWQLSGLSTISRCRKTLSEDGYFAAIKFNQQDAICLDGRRLTLVSGSEWSNQATYHTKIETGQRVRLLHNAGTIYFSVNRPDGSKYIYGNSSDSIQKDGQSNQIYSWHLSEIIDASGNKIEFEYINGERHQALLSKIEYSGNVVNFNYDSLRLDKKSGYFQGNKFYSDLRLNSAITTNHNGVVISSYHLDYTYSSNTQSSLLNVLQQCNGKREDEGGSCMKTTFAHNDNLYAPNQVIIKNLEDIVDGEKIQKMLSADVNGDGKLDYVFSYGAGNNLKIKVALFDGLSIVRNFEVFARSGFSLTDTDGDGAAEIIVRDYDGNNESEVIYHWSGNFYNGFFEAETVDSSIKEHGTFGADFDGNGLPDRQNLQQHWLNKNNTWTSIASFSGADLLSFLGHNDFDTNGGLTRVTHESMSDATGGSVDFNSDGIPDIFNVTLRTSITVDNPTEPDCMDTNICRLELIYDAVSIGTSASDIFISENFGNFGNSGELNDSNPVPNYVFPDINGDGNADVFDMSGSSNTANQGVLKGTGLQSETVTPPPYRMFSWYADVNMDGADDFVFKPENENVLYYKTFDSINNVWSEDIEMPDSAGAAEKIVGGRQIVSFSDVNGDGLYDYSIVDLDEKFVWIQHGAFNQAGIDLITSINEGDVKGINIEYMGAMVNYGHCGKRGGSFYRDDEVHCVYVSSDESILQPGAFGSAIINLNPAINLVKFSQKFNFEAYGSEEYISQILTSDNSYQYKGYRIQAGGVGSLGFESILVFDGMSNTTTVSDYYQEYPYTGMLKKKNVYSSPKGKFVFNDDSKLLSSYVVQEIADIGINSNRTRFISNKKYLEKTYTINFQDDTLSSDNVYIKSVTSDNIFEAVADAYVNLSSASKTTTDELNVISYTISNSYEYTQDDIIKWWVGKVTKQVTNHQRTGAYTSGDAVSRTMAYTYYSDNGLLENEIIEPDGDNNSYLKTHFKYDSFGNKIATTQCSLSFAGQCGDDALSSTMANSADIFRRQNSIFDTDGRYLKEVQISGLTQQYFDQYNQLGKPTSIRLLQNDVPVQTDIFYDDFGREYFRRSADGSAVSTAIAKNDGNGPEQAAYQITVASNVAPTTKQYLSATGNIFRSSTQSFDGRWIHVDTNYDEGSNLKISESVPYFSGEPEPASSSLGYDGLNRLKRQTAADGTETSFEYIALTTKKNVVASYSGVLVSWSAVVNRSSSTMTNAFGEIIKVIDEHGKQQTFSYDAVGNADLLTGVDGIQIDPDFDSYGRRTALNDPNKGNWQFSYNGLGELIKTTAPDSIVTEEFRDNQGRVRLRTVTKGSDVETSQFVYQGQRLTGTTVTGGPQQNFGYDQLGRPNSTTTIIDSLTFTSSKTYDEFGRVFQHFDASGNSRGLRYGYNDYGYLLFMREAATGVNGTKYYEVQAMDERGNVTSSQAGNGLTTLRNFDQKTGFMKDIQTGTAGQVQSLAYEFDGVGNLRARIDYNNLDITDTTQSLHEEFEYDDLNRLTTVKRNLAGNLLTTQQLSYDDNGNILTKSDMQAGATYDYSTRPAQCSSTSLVGGHSVQQIGQFSYCYDGRGNQTHQYKDATLQRQVDYSNFDLPVKITSLTGTTRFTYDIERKRIKRVDTENSGTTTTYYLDNVEYQLLPGGSHQYRRYLGDAAIEIVRSNGTAELSYLHRDHLGSVDVISNTAGQKSQCLSFDAFGKRRQCRGWNPVTDAYAELSLGTLLAITPRGFTGHEHVDHAEVIHMNGRIYDPQTGRFMQADPKVQAPEHSQSPNRYSYVFNNPLSYTDPTGYEALIDFDNAMADWRPARGEQLYTTGRLSRPLSSNELKKLNKLAGTLGNQTPADLPAVESDAAKTDQQQTTPTGQAKEYFKGALGTNSYLVSRPLDSDAVGPVAAHMFIVTDATEIGDKDANVISFGELSNGKTGNVGPGSSPSKLSETTYESDWRFWLSLKNDRKLAEQMTTRIAASSKTVRDFATRLEPDTDYQMIGTLFDSTTNSNAAAYAIAYRAAWEDNHKIIGIPLPDNHRSKPNSLHWKYINFRGREDTELKLRN